MLAAVVLLVYSPILALVVMVSMALLALANLAFYPVIRARTEELIRTVANEQTLLMETVRAITTIKLMGREAEREGVWRNAYAKTINASVSLGRFQISLAFVDNVIIGLQTVLVIYLGARAILHAQGFSVGMLMAFLSFRQTFSDRATSLVTQGLQFRLLGLHLERLGNIIAQEAEQHLRNKTPKRKVKAKPSEDRQPASRPNDVWAMDFLHDQLFDGWWQSNAKMSPHLWP